jgi:cytochrome c oxidase subunit 5b
MLALRQRLGSLANRVVPKVETLSVANARLPMHQLQTQRNYRHWWPVLPEDFGLESESMPRDMKTIMKKDPFEMEFIDSYWYWRVRSEATILDPENLPKKSYKQLARDMGLSVVNEPAEHMICLLELYEYLKSSPFVGPFGTLENPVLIPAIHTERVVGCTGGTGDSEHCPLWFRCREGFLYRCGECDQIFMHVRVMYELPDGGDIDPIDPDVNDVFDLALLEASNKAWNGEDGSMMMWPTGYDALNETMHGGEPRSLEIDRPAYQIQSADQTALEMNLGRDQDKLTGKNY